MAIKHIVVHLDGGAGAQSRLELAATLALRLGAGLTGLFAEERAGRTRRDRASASGHSAADVERAFAERARGLRTEWWKIPNSEFDIPGIAARYARYADLTIVGQHDDESRVPPEFAEQILLESGRPILVIPSRARYDDLGRTALLAWDGSREGARALNDALPLLSRARSVTVALIRRTGDRAPRNTASTPSILRHLARHGIDAQPEVLFADRRGRGPDAATAVVNLASDLGADLVVMGGRGTHGTPFPRAARRTRASLQVMAAPLLLSI